MRKILSLLFMIIFLTACEDVIDIETSQTAPRLSIDALIRIDTRTTFTPVFFEANLTSSFFEDLIPAEGAIITITNTDYTQATLDDPKTIEFVESGPGIYSSISSKRTSFYTEGELELNIEFDGQSYTALTKFMPAPPITSLEQGDGTLFGGNEIEVEITFNDDGDSDDFYLFDLDFGDYLVSEDAFYQGQNFEFSYFYDENVEPGQEINISLLGVNEQFYNYMNQIIVQAGGNQGPFQTPAATVRGNIFNITEGGTDNDDNFALGYFAVSQTQTKTITIE